MSIEILKPKGWCEHMLWKNGEWETTSFGNRFYNPEGWFLQMRREDTDGWNYCPLCGVKRPRPICKEHHFMSFKKDKTETCIKCGISKPKKKGLTCP